jgi:hypothetical protein
VNTNPSWREDCSVFGHAPQVADWLALRQNPTCVLESGFEIGYARLIGFSSATHLHYTVYIDRDNDGILAETNPRDFVDPLIARAMPH